MATHNGTTSTSNSFLNCTNKYFNYILPASYSLVLVVGMGLNITAMYFIIFRTKHWKPCTIYMINLNVCDTLYILTLPFLIYYYADGNDWPFGEVMCKLIRFLFYTNLYASILFLSCISLHRFVGVCHPVISLSWMSGRQAPLVSVGIWATMLIVQAPILYFSRTQQNADRLVCHDTTIPDFYDDFLVYSLVVMFLLFVVPFGVVLICNVLMVKRLRQSNILGGSVSQHSKQKSVKMIIIVVLTFTLCFLPYHVNRIFYYTIRNTDQPSCEVLRLSNSIYNVTRILASTNCCIDPILYFMAGQGYRQIFSKESNNQSDKFTSTL